MRFVLATRGSRGDIMPMLEIATRLQQEGHEVLLCLPPLFEADARARHLDCCFYGEDSNQLMRGLASAWAGARGVVRWLSTALDEQFERMLQITASADALITTVNEVTAPAVSQHRRIPHFRLALAPVLVGDPPPPLQPFQRVPVVVSHAMWDAINGGIRLVFGRQLERWHRRLGLGPIGNMADYFAGSSHNLLAISKLLAPPSPSWRHRHSYTGYPFGATSGELPTDIQEFLQAGPKPIFIGFGSLHLKKKHALAELFLEAISQARCRAIIYRGWGGFTDGLPLPDGVIRIGDVPHDLLFPHLAGIAHHGGSGTTHRSTRHGLPQLIMPRIVDQYYWGHRIHVLGLGPAPQAPAKLTVRKLARALRLLPSPSLYAQRARATAKLMAREDGVSEAVSVIFRDLGLAAQPAARVHQ